MEEILKQILSRMDSLEVTVNKGLTDVNEKIDKGLSDVNNKIDSLSDRIDAHDRNNKEEFRQVNRKIDSIAEVVAKTMEDVTELKDKVEKQDVEIRVIKGL